MKHNLQKLLQEILKDMGVVDVTPDVTISDDFHNGEYTTNVAMKLAKFLKKSPMEIALQVSQTVNSLQLTVNSKRLDPNNSKKGQNISEKETYLDMLQAIDHIDVVAPGFLNIFLTESALGSRIEEVLKTGESYGTVPKQDKHLMVEYTDPNPFKEFHMGHLYSNAVGESLARLYEANGWQVVRADYFGDVGMHVAKSIWGMMKKKNELLFMKKKPLSDRARWLGQCYALGASIYEEKTSEAEQAKEEMKDINYMVYLAAQEFMQKTLKWQPQVDYRQHVNMEDGAYQKVKLMFETGRAWSMDYFETIFRRLGTKFDAYYPESIVGEYGAKLVHEHIGRVFEESEGAVVFRGTHTRVFLNSLGLPTYEAKELGLNWKKSQDYQLDKSYIVTGNEINEYFKVVLSAMSQVVPEAAQKTRHIGHGMVRNPDGSKMSSRKGNVLTGEGLLDEVKKSIYDILHQNKSDYTKAEQDDIAEKAAIAAVKYSLLRVALPANVAFSLSTSVSFDGDSGPYLLYTYARCKSVLRKAPPLSSSRRRGSELVSKELDSRLRGNDTGFNPEEHALARLISFFPEIVADAAEHLAPNTLCTYLFRLASVFNALYQKHQIVGEPQRVALTAATAQVLHNGLHLLGIATVERM